MRYNIYCRIFLLTLLSFAIAECRVSAISYDVIIAIRSLAPCTSKESLQSKSNPWTEVMKWVNHLISTIKVEWDASIYIEVNLQSKRRRYGGNLIMYSTSLCIQKFICNLLLPPYHSSPIHSLPVADMICETQWHAWYDMPKKRVLRIYI